jgi:[NiFe] hydrogenase diaphorase moiety small subunit
MNMMSPHFDQFFPDRPVDASHPEYLLDFNRCILCSLCVRASRDVDGKNVFALSGRGIGSHLIVNAKSGHLADTDFCGDDKAAHVCPVGVILKKRVGFAVPIGGRSFDEQPISATPHPQGAYPVCPRSDAATLPPHPQGAYQVVPLSDAAPLPPHPTVKGA